MLEEQWSKGKFVCVGLDSELSRMPPHLLLIGDDLLGNAPYGQNLEVVLEFNRKIIEATQDIVCAYKPNIAFYEQHGPTGMSLLWRTINLILETAPEVPVILDAKRADIGNTNKGYAKMAFEYFKADALTVNPYFGGSALQPFLDRKEKGIIVLCRTSNPGAGEFQSKWLGEDKPLYQEVAYRVSRDWNVNNNCALVVGATAPAELAEVREVVDDMPILIPGIGTQGGDLDLAVRAGRDKRGRGMIINSSSAILFASSGEDFADVARQETEKLNKAITTALLQPDKPRKVGELWT
ncbi:MAG: orotidine-5'-phosphate decarboxylase [Patescibacteria group bacterium]